LKDAEEVDISPALSAAAFSIKGQEELVYQTSSIFHKIKLSSNQS
jgi:hypothetical protein